jgi:4-amino-4-deoxy-L-arabinose transferase-like glycosyltransferase
MPVRERRVVVGAIVVGLALRIAYVLATRHHHLAGDEIEYDLEGRFIAAGHWFWTTTPYGIAHASAWKAPLYPAWVGVVYDILGRDADHVLLLQTLLAIPTIGLSWLLARRLFGPRVAIAAAWVVALYPGTWQYEARLFSEAFVTPLTLALLVTILGRTPTLRRAAGTGALMGALLLLRPSSALLFAGIAVAWWVAAGLRTGSVRLVTAVAVAVAVVAPWTIRNHHVTGGFIPISVQDAAAYGVFNNDAAHSFYPWAWRPLPSRDRDLFDPRHPRGDAALRAELQRRAWAYISKHPTAVPKAFLWNGIVRTWDLRRPSHAFLEIPAEGRTRALAEVAFYAYWLLGALALVALWTVRRRREVVLPLVAIAVATSVVFTTDAGTRYRAPLEPVIAILACVGVERLVAARRGRAPGLATSR